MKKRSLLIMTMICLFLVSPLTLAHSGRTDANGGHRDTNNVSGLGPYHYHHGYPAHLHPNGICPYETSVSQSSSSVSPSISSGSASESSKSDESVPLNMMRDELADFGERLYLQGYEKSSSESSEKINDLTAKNESLAKENKVLFDKISEYERYSKDLRNSVEELSTRLTTLYWLMILIDLSFAGYLYFKFKRK